MTKSPGKAFREGVSLIELLELFPDEQAATAWFESVYWGDERRCGYCGSARIAIVKNAKPLPYRCKDCRQYFSVKTGTAMARSKISLQKWAIAIYLCLTSLKSVSSMKLHRDLKISQPSAWFMLHRLRQAWAGKDDSPFEADESYWGGKRKNMSNAKRKELREAGAGRGAVGKEAVVGIRDRETNQVRARQIRDTRATTVQTFIHQNTAEGSTIYSDEAPVYKSIPGRKHGSVNHSVGEYVREQIHVNGMESFWASLRRAHKGVFHKISPKHLDRYVQEFAGKHNLRDKDTLAQMTAVAAGLMGRRLMYRDLIRPNGLSSGARS